MTGDLGRMQAHGRTRGSSELLRQLGAQPTRGDWEPGRPVSVRYVAESPFVSLNRRVASRSVAAVAGQGSRPSDHARTRVAQLIELARFEAVRGREDRCREHLCHAMALAGSGTLAGVCLLRGSILGLLELGRGNLATAAAHFARCATLTSAFALDGWCSTHEADNAEVLLALGRELEARAAVARQQEHARRSPAPRGLVAAARCRALVADSCAFEREFEVALALHDIVPGDFERARTQLCYGERLRRMRRRVDSRDQLEPALVTFERLEAAPWASRARRELEASCSSNRAPSDPTARDLLTAQEMRVAQIIAHGATVREAAAQLFLSAKTIEAHLGRAYRKLGVHNRAQLVAALSEAT